MIDSVDLVIFDCDGVLVDSETIAIRVASQMLAELGWPLTDDEILENFVGRSAASMVPVIEQKLGRPLPQWPEMFVARQLAAHEAGLVPVPGIVEALNAITLPTCVASSGRHDKMRNTLGITGLYERFEGRIFSATEVANGKPAPDLFLHAAASMGADPARCVVVEDSRPGVQAARAAGMRVLAYAGGVTPADWLTGPDTVVFHDMRKLPDLLRVR